MLVQASNAALGNEDFREALLKQLRMMMDVLKVKIFVITNDVTVTVVGPAVAHELAEKATPFERAIEELPSE